MKLTTQQHKITPQKLESMIKRMIVNEMKRAARAANMPKSFIDNITLTKNSDIHYTIENKWTKDDKPLGVWFEYGTDRHWVEPINKKVLAWKSKGRQSGQAKAIYSKRHDNKRGQWLFSTGHYVSGLPAYEPMHRGWKIGLERMRNEFQKMGGKVR